jgi:hypothetical protein
MSLGPPKCRHKDIPYEPSKPVRNDAPGATLHTRRNGAINIIIMPKQSEYMRKLYREYLEAAEGAVTAQYATAEWDGVVRREKNALDLAPEVYAKKLWRNGWRSDGGKKPYLLEVLQHHVEALQRLVGKGDRAR